MSVAVTCGHEGDVVIRRNRRGNGLMVMVGDVHVWPCIGLVET